MAEMTMFLTTLLLGARPPRAERALDGPWPLMPNGRRGLPSRQVGEASLGRPQGRRPGWPASGRGPSRLPPGAWGRPPMGRRCPRDQGRPALAPRAVADMVRGGRDPAVLSGPPQRILGRAPGLGGGGPRLPPRERWVARGRRVAAGARPAQALVPRSRPCRPALRPAPRVRRVRGLDLRGEGTRVGGVLPRGRRSLTALPTKAPQGPVCVRARALRPRPAHEDRDRH